MDPAHTSTDSPTDSDGDYPDECPGDYLIQPGWTLDGIAFEIPVIPDYDPAMPDDAVRSLMNDYLAMDSGLLNRIEQSTSREEVALLQDAYDLLQLRMSCVFNDHMDMCIGG